MRDEAAAAELFLVVHPPGEVRGQGPPPLAPYWWIAAPKMGRSYISKQGKRVNPPPENATHWTVDGQGYWVEFPKRATVGAGV